MFFWDNKATLAVKDTEPNDTGRYRCEVMNRLGRIESTGSLHVYSASCYLHLITYVDSAFGWKFLSYLNAVFAMSLLQYFIINHLSGSYRFSITFVQ